MWHLYFRMALLFERKTVRVTEGLQVHMAKINPLLKSGKPHKLAENSSEVNFLRHLKPVLFKTCLFKEPQ